MSCSICEHVEGLGHKCLNGEPMTPKDTALWLLAVSGADVRGTADLFAVVMFVADALWALETGGKPGAGNDFVLAALSCVETKDFDMSSEFRENVRERGDVVDFDCEEWDANRLGYAELKQQFPDVCEQLEIAANYVNDNIAYFHTI